MTPEKIIEDIMSRRKKRVIVDCDAGADGDDQFALAYALRSPEIMRVVGVNSAPYNGGGILSVAGAIECEEIIHASGTAEKIPVGTGSPNLIQDTGVPLVSPAARNIAALAEEASETDPLYVVITGCCTNVASALALYPKIRSKVVTVWLALDNLNGSTNTGEFNYRSDIAAGKMLFELSESMVLVCAGCVVAPFARNDEQIKRMFGSGDRLSKWLANRFCEIPWASGLWDLSAYGLFTMPDEYRITEHSRPVFGDDGEICDFDKKRTMVLADACNAQAIIRDATVKINGSSDGVCVFE